MSKKRLKRMMNKEFIIQNCPKCNSSDLAKFLYGLYDRDERLNYLINKGKVILGGCEISFDNPNYYCNDCQNEF